MVTFARYLWHVGMQLSHDVIAYTVRIITDVFRRRDGV